VIPAELPLSLGRFLLNATVERIARAAFPELADARPWTVARRMGDVRDLLDGLPVQTVSAAERARFAIVAAGILAQEPRP
jgi:hypothetical protein